MTLQRQCTLPRAQQGFSLIEILVGLVIGLLAIAATVQTLHTLQLTQNEQSQSMQLDANARQVLNSIAQQLHMSGNQTLRASAQGTVRLQSAATPPVALNDARQLVIQYAVDSDASHASCLWFLGETIGDSSRNTYVLSNGKLSCDNQIQSQPLIEGVRQLQWRLAVASSAGLRWLSPEAVEKQGISGRVAAARVCIHLEGVPSTAAPNEVTSCDGNALNANGRLQVVRERTIWMSALQP